MATTTSDFWLAVLRAPPDFRLASTRLVRVGAEALRARAPGVVKKPETINYRTEVAEPGGLFCEAIFGEGGFEAPAPEVDTPVTAPRATTFGRIELPVPIVDPLVLAHAPDELARCAELSVEDVELLARPVDPERHAELVERLQRSDAGQRCVLQAVAVLPPYLRPMVRVGAGSKWAISNVNDLYRSVVNRVNRLRRLLELNAPPIIVANERRMMREAVHSLYENEEIATPMPSTHDTKYTSLRGLVGGTTGLFETLHTLDAQGLGGEDAVPFELHRKRAAIYAMGFELQPVA